MTDRVGQQLGNYYLTRLLGWGGFADVYLGRHIHLNTLTAIKVLHAPIPTEDIDQFLNEARTLVRLEHPHIIKVLDFGIEDKTPFLVMSYAPNGTLRQLHPKGTVLPVQTVVAYAKQVASALQYLHNQKLIHRDIKPENLLLGSDMEILLSDFGTALIVQTVSVQGDIQEMAGTVTYMAPEQLQGKPRPASDQYGLGVVVYEWLCGQVPFKGTFTELSSQQMLMPPPSLHLKNPEIPSQVEEVVLKALAKEPSQRFTSMTAFSTALDEAANGNYVRDTTPSSGSPDENTVVISNPNTPIPGTYSTYGTNAFKEEPDILQPVPIAKRGVSRRTIVAGITVAALLAAVGGSLVALDLSHLLPGSSTQRSTPTSATPSASATALLVYKYTSHTDWVNGLAWSPDSTRIASASADDSVQIWQATTGVNAANFKHVSRMHSVSWSPDTQHIVSSGRERTVEVQIIPTGNIAYTYTYPRNQKLEINTVAWSFDGKRIAAGANDKIVRVWDAATNGTNLLLYSGHKDVVNAVAWSPDSKRIASASKDNTVQIWDATTGKLQVTYRGHTNEVKSVTWSPDGTRLASASVDMTVQVWDSTLGKQLLVYSRHSPYQVNAVAWSPDDHHIASGGNDEIVHIWSADSGSLITHYTGHKGSPGHSGGYIYTIGWSPDGQYVASGGGDKTVQVWKPL